MRHRDGRPANRLRLVRRSRRRRHGVDDPGGPYLAPGARAGYRYGDSALVDPTAHDALFCSVDMRRTGAATDSYNKAKDIGRAESRTSTRQCRTTGRRPQQRTRCSTTRSSPPRCPSAGVTHCRSARTTGSGPRPRLNLWASCVRRSPGRHGHRRVGQPDLRIGHARFKKKRLGVRLSARPFRP
jgi:hypothetical protein